MTPRNSLEAGVAPLKLEAIDWASRLAIGPLTDDDWQAFEAWRRSSPAHEDAFRAASAFMDELRTLDLSEIQKDVEAAPFWRSPLINRRAILGGGGVAAALAASVVATQSPLGLWPSLAELMADERTHLGERRVYSPTPGVNVELSSRSSVSSVDHGVRLVSGEIFVSVDDAQKPFQVDVDGGTITAATGRFNVRAYDAELCITCVEGQARSQFGATATDLLPGDTIIYAGSRPARREKVDPGIVTAWRRGLLIFEATPLATAISQINRYFPGRLMLTGDELGRRPITGVFHIAQIELAVVQIQNLTGAAARRVPGNIVVIG